MKILTPKQAAEILQISAKTVASMCARDEIPGARRIGRLRRIPEHGLEALFPPAPPSLEYLDQVDAAVPSMASSFSSVGRGAAGTSVGVGRERPWRRTRGPSEAELDRRYKAAIERLKGPLDDEERRKTLRIASRCDPRRREIRAMLSPNLFVGGRRG